MIKFLILLLVALIVFPIVIIFVKKVDLKTKLMFLVGGFVIALLGMVVQSTTSLYYAVLIMIGLIFAGSVLLTKRLENEKQQENNYVFVQPVKQEPDPMPSEPVVAPPVQPVEVKQEDDWLKPAKKEGQ